MRCLDQAPRAPLLVGPTPFHRLDRVSEALDLDVWIKRDDLTPLALGGNKLRKLEYLIGAARAAGADTVVTLGAAQSNHCAQTAAAAARYGLRAVLLLRGPLDAEPQGNLRLNALFGAEVRLDPAPAQDWGELVVAELRAAGQTPYLIPYGGSDGVGVLGYASAGRELAGQLAAAYANQAAAATAAATITSTSDGTPSPTSEAELATPFAEIIVASSSGGTQAGLQLASANGIGLPRVLGVSADLAADALASRVVEIAALGADLFALAPVPPQAVHTTDAYVGAGYALPDERTTRAVERLARLEGIVLDPVYTGKAFAALLDLAESGRWPRGARVLFWHTGGAAALFGAPAAGRKVS